MSTTTIDLRSGQRRLAYLWIAGGALAGLALLVETMGPESPLQAESSWQWFLPLVVPTFSLMLGTLVFNSKQPSETRSVDRSVFVACVFLSLLYLVSINGLLLLWPFMRLGPSQVKDMLDKSKYWLPAIQGLAGIALGAFFVAKARD